MNKCEVCAAGANVRIFGWSPKGGARWYFLCPRCSSKNRHPA